MILNHCRIVLVPIPHAFEFIGLHKTDQRDSEIARRPTELV
jgi:hypothetical protein